MTGIVGITSPKIDAYDPRSVHFGFQPVPDGEHRGRSLNVIWMKPEAAIFGSSVAAEGFNPDNSFWNLNGAFVAYNYGISGLSIREMEQHFEHIQALKPIKKLLIVLDFFAFNALKPAIAFEQVKILPFAHRLTAYPNQYSSNLYPQSYERSVHIDPRDSLAPEKKVLSGFLMHPCDWQCDYVR